MALARRTTEIMRSQRTGEHDAMQVDLQRTQVGGRGRIILFVLATILGMAKSVGVKIRPLDNPCICKNKIQPSMALENSLESRGQFVINAHIGLVKRSLWMQVVDSLEAPFLVDVQQMNVPVLSREGFGHCQAHATGCFF